MRIVDETLLASGARTTTQTLGPYSNPDSWSPVEDIEVVVDLTAFTTAASLTVSIEEFNVGSAAYRTVVSATALTATGVARLRYGPHCTTVTNVSLQGLIGSLYRVVVTHGNANSHTYSVVIKRARPV